MTISLDDLGRNRCWLQSQLDTGKFFNLRIHICIGANCSRHFADTNGLLGSEQPFSVAVHLRVPECQFEPKSGRLSVYSVGAAHHHGVTMLVSPSLQNCEQGLQIIEQYVCCLPEQQGETGIQNIGGGQSKMDIAGGISHIFRHAGEKGNDVVFCLALNFFDATHIEVCLLSNLLGRLSRYLSQLSHSVDYS